ncbi:MAG: hypothetical protein ACRDPC_27385 [Solirubrobacteraceae bacterium]
MSVSTLRRAGAAATIVTGLGLFGFALQGLTRVDSSLERAAVRSTPERALVLETGARGWECDRAGKTKV